MERKVLFFCLVALTGTLAYALTFDPVWAWVAVYGVVAAIHNRIHA